MRPSLRNIGCDSPTQWWPLQTQTPGNTRRRTAADREDTGIPPPTQGVRDRAVPIGDRWALALDQAGFSRASAWFGPTPEFVSGQYASSGSGSPSGRTDPGYRVS